MSGGSPDSYSSEDVEIWPSDLPYESFVVDGNGIQSLSVGVFFMEAFTSSAEDVAKADELCRTFGKNVDIN